MLFTSLILNDILLYEDLTLFLRLQNHIQDIFCEDSYGSHVVLVR